VKQAEPGLLPGSEVEWTGLFLLGVGAFGAHQRDVTRHLVLFGWLPLDWFYVGLLLTGATMLLASSPIAPREIAAAAHRRSPLYVVFLGFRLAFAMALLGLLAWYGLRR
jgi:hypothetical protein